MRIGFRAYPALVRASLPRPVRATGWAPLDLAAAATAIHGRYLSTLSVLKGDLNAARGAKTQETPEAQGTEGKQGTQGAQAQVKSKGRAFREIELDMKLLQHLDTANVGILSRRRGRVVVAKRLDPRNKKDLPEPEEEQFRGPPYPFRSAAKVLLRAAEYREVVRAIPGFAPEVALVGRSNVGKSTLLNALVGFDNSYVQKAVVSDKPGETRKLTFFQLGSRVVQPEEDPTKEVKGVEKVEEKARGFGMIQVQAGGPAGPKVEQTKTLRAPALLLVDMPGFGFAFMNDEDKLRCHKLTMDYLTSNATRNRALKRVVLLLDGRHGIKAADVQFMQELLRYLVTGGESLKSMIENEGKGEVEGADALASLTGKEIKQLSQQLGWKLQIVLTKCDLVDRNELCRRIDQVTLEVSEKLPALYHSMLPVVALSAMKRRGLITLQKELAAMVPRAAQSSQIRAWARADSLVQIGLAGTEAQAQTEGVEAQAQTEGAEAQTEAQVTGVIEAQAAQRSARALGRRKAGISSCVRALG
eukprot:CAMPEP_0173278520 /NCGR_PEP_ID=MMETSP1143-20121109/4661_1 /TAXON_ID=483371 /ORGANISM="non described non described, Strain CCMP2298" /LENGTH=528 /DNA_ID=CAMNT_0014215691 /DNA_START=67 /DNA_END=1651 /DNA_ORIENTATION=-